MTIKFTQEERKYLEKENYKLKIAGGCPKRIREKEPILQ